MPADADGRAGFAAGDIGRRARQRRIVNVGKREMAIATRQRDRDRASNSASRSSDDGRLAFELQHDRGPGLVGEELAISSDWSRVLEQT